MAKVRLATVWLSGCSGCHMSFLDQDEKVLELAEKIELVYSPIADVKDFPENVDVTLVEGAVGNEEQLELLKRIRRNTRVLVALGDCAVNGNVTALRNSLRNSDEEVLERAYVENASINQAAPKQVPRLLKRVLALNEVVKVDAYVPGCPPSAELINHVLNDLVEGRTPVLEGRFKYG
ncbi:MAG: oxidoreductase [Candidatus Brockarchaeota archaeon]|nr:oxidoreductase [Candidatus Brockarchaeota archaeon]MBO3809363.1 oxidoreductase [Candidatus Brockarchaeota archaeon]